MVHVKSDDVLQLLLETRIGAVVEGSESVRLKIMLDEGAMTGVAVDSMMVYETAHTPTPQTGGRLVFETFVSSHVGAEGGGCAC